METQNKTSDLEIFLLALFAKVYEIRPKPVILFTSDSYRVHKFFIDNIEAIQSLLHNTTLTVGIKLGDKHEIVSELQELILRWSDQKKIGNLANSYIFRPNQETCLKELPSEYYANNEYLITKLANQFITCLMSR